MTMYHLISIVILSKFEILIQVADHGTGSRRL